MKITFNATGISDLQDALGSFEKKVTSKIVRSALRKGATMIKKEASTNAKKIVGGDMGKKLSKAMTVRVIKKQRRGKYGYYVSYKNAESAGLVYVAKSNKKKSFIPAAIEYGHSNRGGRGKVRPIEFMGKAFRDTDEPVKRRVLEEIRKGIENVKSKT